MALDVETGARRELGERVRGGPNVLRHRRPTSLFSFGLRPEEDRLERHPGFRESVVGENAAVGEEGEVVDLLDFVANLAKGAPFAVQVLNAVF